MATTTPLGIVKLDGVTVAKMELLEAAARKQFGGTNLSATSGTIQDHGASAIYEYDGTDILTISIIKLPSIFGHKLMNVPELQSKILAWVEEVINPQSQFQLQRMSFRLLFQSQSQSWIKLLQRQFLQLLFQ